MIWTEGDRLSQSRRFAGKCAPLKGSETCTLHDPQRGALLNCIFLRKPKGFLRKGRPRIQAVGQLGENCPRCFCGEILLRKKRRMRGIDRKASVRVPPSAAGGDSFPQRGTPLRRPWLRRKSNPSASPVRGEMARFRRETGIYNPSVTREARATSLYTREALEGAAV